MKSTGNDIVALASVDKRRTGEFRFYSKILCVYEQSLYLRPEFAEMPFVNYVWLLWSVKESAYKYLKRNIPGLVFSPTKIVTQYIEIPVGIPMTKSGGIPWENTGNCEEFYRGMVIFGSHILYFRSKISGDWIATVVNDDENFENVFWGVQSINDTGHSHQSQAVRTLLVSRLQSFFPGDFRLGKSPTGYPVILKESQDMDIPASLSHDNRFIAYSFILNPKKTQTRHKIDHNRDLFSPKQLFIDFSGL